MLGERGGFGCLQLHNVAPVHGPMACCGECPVVCMGVALAGGVIVCHSMCHTFSCVELLGVRRYRGRGYTLVVHAAGFMHVRSRPVHSGGAEAKGGLCGVCCGCVVVWGGGR